ncbi:MAG: hypothetical protein DMG80_14255, partial [Acidobacteria bacterium]
NIRCLDRIHRGTPWQTLYFDRAATPASDWARVSLDPFSHPTNDWKIIEYLRSQLQYEETAAPTRVLNNTVVGNDGGGLFVATNAHATVMNNAVAYNSSGLVSEGSATVEFSRNCTFANWTDNTADVSAAPQFLNDFSLIATSPLIDAGDNSALAWIERDVLGAGLDIGALEFGPDGVPAFAPTQTGQFDYHFELRAYPGQNYVVEASTNLTDWVPVSTNVAEIGSVLFTDVVGTNYPHRFYRATTAK